MAKDKQTNIWDKIPEVEEDKRIMEIMWKLGGGFKEDKINEKINKLKINKQKQDDVVKLHGRQNNIEYQLSERYSVGFYTLAGYAIFRYYEKWEYKREIGRDNILGRLSEGERKKLSDFEAEIKEIFKEYEEYIM